MSRLTHCATASGWTIADWRASLPTTTSWSAKSTTLGVSGSPSALGMIEVLPDSSTQATAEKVVPKSIPRGRWLDINPVYPELAGRLKRYGAWTCVANRIILSAWLPLIALRPPNNCWTPPTSGHANCCAESSL